MNNRLVKPKSIDYGRHQDHQRSLKANSQFGDSFWKLKTIRNDKK